MKGEHAIDFEGGLTMRFIQTLVALTLLVLGHALEVVGVSFSGRATDGRWPDEVFWDAVEDVRGWLVYVRWLKPARECKFCRRSNKS